MGEFCFVHAADLHLDTPFVGLGRDAPTWAERLRDASLKALDRLVKLAIEREAAFVVFAGDIYDGVHRGIRAQLRFRQALQRLGEHGIRAFVAHGNHDPVRGEWSAIPNWPDNTFVFPPGEVASAVVERDGRRLATLHGISFARPDETENLSRKFSRPAPGGLHIGVLHCNVGDIEGHDRYSPCTLEDLCGVGMGYWALGHVHTHRVLHEAPWVVYPGSMQARRFGAVERGAKGAVVVTARNDTVLRAEHVPLDEARFVDLEVDASGIRSLEALADALGEALERRSEEHAGVGLIVRAWVSGRTTLSGMLANVMQRGELLRTLRDTSPPDVHWAQLRSTAQPPIDLDRLAGGADLRAAVIEEWRRLKELPAAALEAELRPLLGNGPIPDIGALDLARMLDEASWHLLDVLGDEGE